MSEIQTQAQSKAEAIENVLISGDLSKLDASQRVSYVKQVCESLGLNYLTQPFAYITLNGKLVLYAKRDAADQLRRIHGISIKIVSRIVEDNILTVHVSAKDKDGREDEDFGVVSIANLKGDNLANAGMKAVTKAKRRVTLSLAGLGWLDETEVETVVDRGPETPAENAYSVMATAITGNVPGTEPAIDADVIDTTPESAAKPKNPIIEFIVLIENAKSRKELMVIAHDIKARSVRSPELVSAWAKRNNELAADVAKQESAPKTESAPTQVA